MKKISAFIFFCALSFFSVGCTKKSEVNIIKEKESSTILQSKANRDVNLRKSLDKYTPQKKNYNFYFTYKIVHPWWDAVGIGIEDAVRKYEERGIEIQYDYLAPQKKSALNQAMRIRNAAKSKEYDVIGIDVADINLVVPAINQAAASGQKIMTFSSSDACKENGCKRIAFVGNAHNFSDGEEIARALCNKIDNKGKIAILLGSKGNPCHEQRAAGAIKVVSAHPDIQIVSAEYDDDIVDKAFNLTNEIIEKYDDLKGIICCDMNNPVGAARAVLSSGKSGKIALVGMDHNLEALHYLRDGIIYALGIQDCYSIGFDTILVAVKIADGLLPGELFPEKTDEKTSIIYKDDASELLQILYGEKK